MLNIDRNSALEILLGSNVTANQLPFVVSYNDRQSTTVVHGEIASGKTSDTIAIYTVCKSYISYRKGIIKT